MASESQNVTMWQGEDTIINFYVTDEADNPKNLTGATIDWGMWNGSTRLLMKTSGNGGATVANGDGTGDVVRITLVKADTVNVGAEALYYHECRISLAGAERVIATGNVLLKESRTAQ